MKFSYTPVFSDMSRLVSWFFYVFSTLAHSPLLFPSKFSAVFSRDIFHDRKVLNNRKWPAVQKLMNGRKHNHARAPKLKTRIRMGPGTTSPCKGSAALTWRASCLCSPCCSSWSRWPRGGPGEAVLLWPYRPSPSRSPATWFSQKH